MPASSMQWVVKQGGSAERRESDTEESKAAGGGLVTTSSLTLVAGNGPHVVLECYAANSEMTDQMVTVTHDVTIYSKLE